MPSEKKTPQQIVRQCEALLRDNNMAGVVVAMDEEEGFYGLTLHNDSLFEWREDDSQVRIHMASRNDAEIQHRVEEEFHVLKTLGDMLDYCNRSILALAELLGEAFQDKSDEMPDTTVKRRNDN